MARFPTARFEYRHGKGRWRWLPGASAVSGGGKPKFVGHCYQVTVKGAPGRISAEYRMVTVQSAAYLAATSRAVWLRK